MANPNWSPEILDLFETSGAKATSLELFYDFFGSESMMHNVFVARKKKDLLKANLAGVLDISDEKAQEIADAIFRLASPSTAPNLPTVIRLLTNALYGRKDDITESFCYEFLHLVPVVADCAEIQDLDARSLYQALNSKLHDLTESDNHLFVTLLHAVLLRLVQRENNRYISPQNETIQILLNFLSSPTTQRPELLIIVARSIETLVRDDSQCQRIFDVNSGPTLCLDAIQKWLPENQFGICHYLTLSILSSFRKNPANIDLVKDSNPASLFLQCYCASSSFPSSEIDALKANYPHQENQDAIFDVIISQHEKVGIHVNDMDIADVEDWLGHKHQVSAGSEEDEDSQETSRSSNSTSQKQELPETPDSPHKDEQKSTELNENNQDDSQESEPAPLNPTIPTLTERWLLCSSSAAVLALIHQVEAHPVDILSKITNYTLHACCTLNIFEFPLSENITPSSQLPFSHKHQFHFRAATAVSSLTKIIGESLFTVIIEQLKYTLSYSHHSARSLFAAVSFIVASCSFIDDKDGEKTLETTQAELILSKFLLSGGIPIVADVFSTLAMVGSIQLTDNDPNHLNISAYLEDVTSLSPFTLSPTIFNESTLSRSQLNYILTLYSLQVSASAVSVLSLVSGHHSTIDNIIHDSSIVPTLIKLIHFLRVPAQESFTNGPDLTPTKKILLKHSQQLLSSLSDTIHVTSFTKHFLNSNATTALVELLEDTAEFIWVASIRKTQAKIQKQRELEQKEEEERKMEEERRAEEERKANEAEILESTSEDTLVEEKKEEETAVEEEKKEEETAVEEEKKEEVEPEGEKKEEETPADEKKETTEEEKEETPAEEKKEEEAAAEEVKEENAETEQKETTEGEKIEETAGEEKKEEAEPEGEKEEAPTEEEKKEEAAVEEKKEETPAEEKKEEETAVEEKKEEETPTEEKKEEETAVEEEKKKEAEQEGEKKEEETPMEEKKEEEAAVEEKKEEAPTEEKKEEETPAEEKKEEETASEEKKEEAESEGEKKEEETPTEEKKEEETVEEKKDEAPTEEEKKDEIPAEEKKEEETEDIDRLQGGGEADSEDDDEAEPLEQSDNHPPPHTPTDRFADTTPITSDSNQQAIQQLEQQAQEAEDVEVEDPEITEAKQLLSDILNIAGVLLDDSIGLPEEGSMQDDHLHTAAHQSALATLLSHSLTNPLLIVASSFPCLKTHLVGNVNQNKTEKKGEKNPIELIDPTSLNGLARMLLCHFSKLLLPSLISVLARVLNEHMTIKSDEDTAPVKKSEDDFFALIHSLTHPQHVSDEIPEVKFFEETEVNVDDLPSEMILLFSLLPTAFSLFSQTMTDIVSRMSFIRCGGVPVLLTFYQFTNSIQASIKKQNPVRDTEILEFCQSIQINIMSLLSSLSSQLIQPLLIFIQSAPLPAVFEHPFLFSLVFKIASNSANHTTLQLCSGASIIANLIVSFEKVLIRQSSPDTLVDLSPNLMLSLSLLCDTLFVLGQSSPVVLQEVLSLQLPQYLMSITRRLPSPPSLDMGYLSSSLLCPNQLPHALTGLLSSKSTPMLIQNSVPNSPQKPFTPRQTNPVSTRRHRDSVASSATRRSQQQHNPFLLLSLLQPLHCNQEGIKTQAPLIPSSQTLASLTEKSTVTASATTMHLIALLSLFGEPLMDLILKEKEQIPKHPSDIPLRSSSLLLILHAAIASFNAEQQAEHQSSTQPAHAAFIPSVIKTLILTLSQHLPRSFESLVDTKKSGSSETKSTRIKVQQSLSPSNAIVNICLDILSTILTPPLPTGPGAQSSNNPNLMTALSAGLIHPLALIATGSVECLGSKYGQSLTEEKTHDAYQNPFSTGPICQCSGCTELKMKAFNLLVQTESLCVPSFTNLIHSVNAVGQGRFGLTLPQSEADSDESQEKKAPLPISLFSSLQNCDKTILSTASVIVAEQIIRLFQILQQTAQHDNESHGYAMFLHSYGNTNRPDRSESKFNKQLQTASFLSELVHTACKSQRWLVNNGFAQRFVKKSDPPKFPPSHAFLSTFSSTIVPILIQILSTTSILDDKLSQEELIEKMNDSMFIFHLIVSFQQNSNFVQLVLDNNGPLVFFTLLSSLFTLNETRYVTEHTETQSYEAMPSPVPDASQTPLSPFEGDGTTSAQDLESLQPIKQSTQCSYSEDAFVRCACDVLKVLVILFHSSIQHHQSQDSVTSTDAFLVFFVQLIRLFSLRSLPTFHGKPSDLTISTIVATLRSTLTQNLFVFVAENNLQPTRANSMASTRSSLATPKNVRSPFGESLASSLDTIVTLSCVMIQYLQIKAVPLCLTILDAPDKLSLSPSLIGIPVEAQPKIIHILIQSTLTVLNAIISQQAEKIESVGRSGGVSVLLNVIRESGRLNEWQMSGLEDIFQEKKPRPNHQLSPLVESTIPDIIDVIASEIETGNVEGESEPAKQPSEAEDPFEVAPVDMLAGSISSSVLATLISSGNKSWSEEVVSYFVRGQEDKETEENLHSVEALTRMAVRMLAVTIDESKTAMAGIVEKVDVEEQEDKMDEVEKDDQEENESVKEDNKTDDDEQHVDEDIPEKLSQTSQDIPDTPAENQKTDEEEKEQAEEQKEEDEKKEEETPVEEKKDETPEEEKEEKKEEKTETEQKETTEEEKEETVVEEKKEEADPEGEIKEEAAVEEEKDEAPVEEKKEEETPEGEKKDEEAAIEEEKKEETPSEEKKEEETPAEEKKEDETAVEEKKEEEKAETEGEKEETAVEEKKDEAPPEEEKKEETAVEEKKEEETPAEEKKEEETAVEETQVEEKKDEAPTEEEKKDKVPAEEERKDEAPTEEEKKDEAPAEGEKEKPSESTEETEDIDRLQGGGDPDSEAEGDQPEQTEEQPKTEEVKEEEKKEEGEQTAKEIIESLPLADDNERFDTVLIDKKKPETSEESEQKEEEKKEEAPAEEEKKEEETATEEKKEEAEAEGEKKEEETPEEEKKEDSGVAEEEKKEDETAVEEKKEEEKAETEGEKEETVVEEKKEETPAEEEKKEEETAVEEKKEDEAPVEEKKEESSESKEETAAEEKKEDAEPEGEKKEEEAAVEEKKKEEAPAEETKEQQPDEAKEDNIPTDEENKVEEKKEEESAEEEKKVEETTIDDTQKEDDDKQEQTEVSEESKEDVQQETKDEQEDNKDDVSQESKEETVKEEKSGSESTADEEREEKTSQSTKSSHSSHHSSTPKKLPTTKKAAIIEWTPSPVDTDEATNGVSSVIAILLGLGQSAIPHLMKQASTIITDLDRSVETILSNPDALDNDNNFFNSVFFTRLELQLCVLMYVLSTYVSDTLSLPLRTSPAPSGTSSPQVLSPTTHPHRRRQISTNKLSSTLKEEEKNNTDWLVEIVEKRFAQLFVSGGVNVWLRLLKRVAELVVIFRTVVSRKEAAAKNPTEEQPSSLTSHINTQIRPIHAVLSQLHYSLTTQQTSPLPQLTILNQLASALTVLITSYPSSPVSFVIQRKATQGNAAMSRTMTSARPRSPTITSSATSNYVPQVSTFNIDSEHPIFNCFQFIVPVVAVLLRFKPRAPVPAPMKLTQLLAQTPMQTLLQQTNTNKRVASTSSLFASANLDLLTAIEDIRDKTTSGMAMLLRDATEWEQDEKHPDPLELEPIQLPDLSADPASPEKPGGLGLTISVPSETSRWDLLSTEGTSRFVSVAQCIDPDTNELLTCAITADTNQLVFINETGEPFIVDLAMDKFDEADSFDEIQNPAFTFYDEENIASHSQSKTVKFVDVRAGHHHFVALTEDGQVLSYGDNSNGECGRGERKIRVGWGFVDFVDEKRPQPKGQTTPASRSTNKPGSDGPTPTAVTVRRSGQTAEKGIDKTVRIKSIASGIHHTVCVSDNNRVFAWGLNTNGQLGLGDTITRYNPVELTDAKLTVLYQTSDGREKEVQAEEEIKRETDFERRATKQAFNSPSLLRGFNTSPSRSGHNPQLNLTHVSTRSTVTSVSPTRSREGSVANATSARNASRQNPHGVFGRHKIVQVAAGAAHTLFLSQNGDVLVTGKNLVGQLGVTTSIVCSSQLTPFKLPSLSFASSQPASQTTVSCVYAGSYHSACLTSTGEVFLWGMNNNGQIGIRSNKIGHAMMPQLVSQFVTGRESCVSVALGHESTAIMTSSGRILMCGKGSMEIGKSEDEKAFINKNTSFVDMTATIQTTTESTMTRGMKVIGGRCNMTFLVE
ncbi:hypothetical protein BLNAU_2205 [Blattamonas nauphoetae]|uniref:HECT-type E3 ubiquitin transferase n=1 Tax=Blattamonas nauphoetae TaxID=2049346 RepID=A0ABQ9YG82_9EUKA|nr:hypothetical protein BLNAU_2205 [Blattamonas nauphoetae]